MLPELVLNVYCHKCGKIVTSNIKKKPLKECEEIIKKWLEMPYCLDCLHSKEHI